MYDGLFLEFLLLNWNLGKVRCLFPKIRFCGTPTKMQKRHENMTEKPNCHLKVADNGKFPVRYKKDERI